MIGIVLEWVLACVVVGGLTVGGYRLWVRFTFAGKRTHRQLHKSVIETGAEVRCPIHGLFDLADSVDTQFGEVCPQCYAEYVRIPTFTINTRSE